ncbi:UDP-glucose 4-epimerase GalE [Bacteriovoracales bacterium]|nr:UDP-glucose 4-epimerase GalE [Bacteriovoracales bacterium]
MKILITGGAGYIGSHVIKNLIQYENHELFVYDNLSTGKRKAILGGTFILGDLENREKLKKLFLKEKFDVVIHFAGSIIVPESVSNPILYYKNNVSNSVCLLKLCKEFKVNNFIFSSTASVYGIPEKGIANEETPLNPVNPYGRSKMIVEMMLKDFAYSNPSFKYCILRYFNVAGADPQGRIGQENLKSTHLIKRICEVASGKIDKLSIYGNNYNTFDGTCIRDFIHVEDLATAHIAALEYLSNGGSSNIFNVGYGKGSSVKEIIEVTEQKLNRAIKYDISERRPGDPPILISDNKKIKETINWTPQFDDIGSIVTSAYNWEKSLTIS